jgi:hypothetical protein
MTAFLFPFDKIPYGSTIALYGAGECGKLFYKQILASGYASVALWVDRRSEDLKHYFPICPVADLEQGGYDFLVIAISDEKLAGEIAASLRSDFSVPQEKIVTTVHSLPEHVYANQQQEYDCFLKNSDELIKIAPRELVNGNRLDTMVRYLVCRDILHGIENAANLSLYSRMLLCRGNRNEGTHYFQETARFSTQDFVAEIRKMCESMRDNGFDRAHYIPLAGENRITLNGQHRLAAAMALEEDIWVRYYQGTKANEDFNYNWFVQNGFGTNDLLRIYRAFADLYPKCGMFLLYGPCYPQWDFITKQMEKHFTLVGFVDLDFSHNYLAFENLLHEIYNDPLWLDCYMDRKMKLLKIAPLKVRVILLSDENQNANCADDDFFDSLKKFKLQIRDAMFFDTDIAPIVMHGSDTRSEFVRMKNILLSPNNLLNLTKRVSRNYREELIIKINRAKALLDSNCIKHDDVVIVCSSAMEVFGLRPARDFDVAVKKSYRDRLGYVMFQWDNDIEYCRFNCIEDKYGKNYPDDLIIADDNLHFVFCGLKFLNLELVKLKKEHDQRAKDIEDIRLIDVFQDYWQNYDDKLALQRQIDKEIYLKRL